LADLQMWMNNESDEEERIGQNVTLKRKMRELHALM